VDQRYDPLGGALVQVPDDAIRYGAPRPGSVPGHEGPEPGAPPIELPPSVPTTVTAPPSVPIPPETPPANPMREIASLGGADSGDDVTVVIDVNQGQNTSQAVTTGAAAQQSTGVSIGTWAAVAAAGVGLILLVVLMGKGGGGG